MDDLHFLKKRQNELGRIKQEKLSYFFQVAEGVMKGLKSYLVDYDFVIHYPAKKLSNDSSWDSEKEMDCFMRYLLKNFKTCFMEHLEQHIDKLKKSEEQVQKFEARLKKAEETVSEKVGRYIDLELYADLEHYSKLYDEIKNETYRRNEYSDRLQEAIIAEFMKYFKDDILKKLESDIADLKNRFSKNLDIIEGKLSKL